MPPDQLRYWDYLTGEPFRYEYWMYQGLYCKCDGTGWVCQTCSGAKWYRARNENGHTGAMPCVECSEVAQKPAWNHGEVVHQDWWSEFVRQYGGSRAATAATIDRAAEQVDRERRAAVRAIEPQHIEDEQVSAEVYAGAEVSVY